MTIYSFSLTIRLCNMRLAKLKKMVIIRLIIKKYIRKRKSWWWKVKIGFKREIKIFETFE